MSMSALKNVVMPSLKSRVRLSKLKKNVKIVVNNLCLCISQCGFNFQIPAFNIFLLFINTFWLLLFEITYHFSQHDHSDKNGHS